jgi:peptidyl-prolyl cis-trans isomerase A (cyclophilin A)
MTLPDLSMDNLRVSNRLHPAAVVAAVALLTACDAAPPPPQEATPTADTSVVESTAEVPAPALFRVRMETTKGPVVIELHRDWAPIGVDRFHELVQNDFFNEARFFRVLPGFVAQFGVPGDPQVAQAWGNRNLQDDPVKQSNRRGTLTYASMAPTPHTRSTQLFINLADNDNLDGMGFAPIGEVVEGMNVVDAFYNGYGEGPPYGPGPDQARITTEGNAYLQRDFPQLDYIRSATIVR